MGEVYRARDLKLPRRVAVKRIASGLRADPDARRRFENEARRAGALDDPHIATVHDVVEHEKELFLVLELVPGRTLRSVLESAPARRIELEEARSIGVQCLRALESAHRAGILHCDLKPENIMVAPSGDVKVLDFGLARARAWGDSESTVSSLTALLPSDAASGGTPGYAAPEALRGKPLDARSDLFSLGVLLHEALAGAHPFRAGDRAQTNERVLHADPPSLTSLNPTVPAPLAGWIERLMARDPAARPTTASEARTELARVCGVSAARRPAGRAIVLGAVAAATLALGTIAFWPPARTAIAVRLGIIDPLPARKVLVVLPFSEVGGDGKPTAFGDGLTYTLTSQLTRAAGQTQGFRIVPAQEVKGAKLERPQDAWKKLGATLVLTGSMQPTENGVRLTIDLLDPKSRRVLRSAALDSPVGRGAALQDRVGSLVAEMVEVELGPDAKAAMRSRGSRDARANALALEGRGWLEHYDDPANLVRAEQAFARAIARDSGFALAWAGLAGARLEDYRATKDVRLVPQARTAISRALALDSTLAEAHLAQGRLYVEEGMAESAVRSYLRAIELDPVSDDAYRGLATALGDLDRPQEAEAAYRKAIALHPDSWVGYSWLGAYYVRQARYPEALGMFSRVVELDSMNARGWRNLGAALSFLERTDESERAFRRSIALRPDATAYSNLGSILYYDGRFVEADRYYARAVELRPADYRWWGNWADCARHVPARAGMADSLYRQAVRLGEQRLAINPRDPQVLAFLAEYRAHLGQADEARRRLKQALQAAPDDPEVAFVAAIVEETLGNRERALEHARNALSLGYSAIEIKRNPDLERLRQDSRMPPLQGG